MKKITFLIVALFSTLIIANIKSWIDYSDHFPNPLLVINIIKYRGLQTDPKIILNIAISFFFLIFMIRQILSSSSKDNLAKKNTNNKYGYAKLTTNLFCLKKRMKDFELNFTKGILLGKMSNKFIRSDKPYSCLVLAPPGTGKTAGIVIPNLLLCENSVIVHDPKGELYEKTAKIREKKLGHKILFFDPIKLNSCKYNVFAKESLPKEKEDYKAYVNNIANIIFLDGKEVNSVNSYFVEAARSAFTFIALYLIKKSGQTSIPKIREKLLENNDTVTTFQAMTSDQDISESLKTDGKGVLVASESENQWAGVMGTLKEKLEIFGDPRIKKVIDSDCDFSGEKLRKEKISLYLKVEDKDRKRLRPLIAMMIDSITTQLISELPKDSDNQVTLILDEFVRLGKLESIAELPSISRGYNVNTIFVAQDYEQITNTYSKEYISIFDSNCSFKIILKQNNLQTAERISKTIGNITDTRTSQSKNKRSMKIFDAGSEGTSKSQEGVALVSSQDILNLPNDMALILIQGFAANPIYAKIPMYFKDKDLKNLIKS
jgi:type IV secretion system protein VirD4